MSIIFFAIAGFLAYNGNKYDQTHLYWSAAMILFFAIMALLMDISQVLKMIERNRYRKAGILDLQYVTAVNIEWVEDLLRYNGIYKVVKINTETEMVYLDNGMHFHFSRFKETQYA